MEVTGYKGEDLITEVTFSSYPGCLSSTDDFLITNRNLVVTETTLDVVDMNLFKNVKKEDEYIPDFMRINSATFFSKSAVLLYANSRKSG